MISLSDAAEALERICDTVSSADEITEEMLNLFQINQQNVAQEVDRAFRYKAYLESQAEYAQKMSVMWDKRNVKMLTMLEKLKASSLAVAKSSAIPLKGEMGKIQIRRNSVPSVDYDQSLVPYEYIRTESNSWVDTPILKRDLLAGKEIEGASLKWGEHVRFTM